MFVSAAKFNSKHRSWLVVWEAGIVVELPPWVPVVYPSGLFLHCNVDVHGEVESLTMYHCAHSIPLHVS